MLAQNSARVHAVNVSTANVTMFAGNGTAAYADGVGTAAAFYNPRGCAVAPDGGAVFVSDYVTQVVRKACTLDLTPPTARTTRQLTLAPNPASTES